MSRPRSIVLLTAAVALGASALSAPATAAAGSPLATDRSTAVASSTTRTFDNEPLGSAPTGSVTRGDVTVAAANFGGATNRVVRVVDSSTTADGSVLFPAAPAAVRTFEADLAFRWIEPMQIAIHGTRDGAPTEAYRLSVATLYNWGKHSSGQVSVTAGTQTRKWAVIDQLTDQYRPTRIELTASAEALVLRVGEFVFRTTDRVAAVDAITGIEFRSGGIQANKAEFYVDNLAITEPANARQLVAGTVATDVPPTLVARSNPRTRVVARIADPAADKQALSARVHVAGRWISAQITGPVGNLLVRAPLVEPNIGVHPITVTVTDTRTGVSRSAQATTAVTAPIPTRTVVQTPEGVKDPRFVDATRLSDGRIVLVYHYADAHGYANGVIQLVSSADNGATWTKPSTVVANQYDNRDPKIMQLRDGTLLLTTFRTNWAAGGANVGTFVLRSTDGGKTFGEETRIEGIRPGTYSHAPAVEMPNGDVLQPLYGSGARLARSTDGGRTFKAENEIMVAADTHEYYYREPNMVLLPSGELVMLIRVHWVSVGAERQSQIVRSFDGGHTWTAPEWTDLPTSSHHMQLTRDGKVLLTFGNILQPNRPTYASLIDRPSQPWTGYPQVPVYYANSGDDQGNPTSVELDDGSFLSFGYNTAERTVVSWRTTARDYR